MSQFSVSKCICHKKDFSEIKAYVEENEITSVRELQDQKYCCCGCGLCAPYIELMLKTGETTFEPGAFYKRKSKPE
jgi:bacterioferritin-associated ferredoxin